ncbi:SDR family oxidoreductase [Aquihabitans sp. G128]|uniref:SDR family oxidoreductase n=1 Tax=Aquihabitans sp. G128 TaxID=2849779 RepID=UPI001C225B83|nr:SDR family oxidoreductase [Aquihabitans sp. G128]QXC63286.1 SDR family oxidoreductase [Aquihabitans sp. G128]
MTSQPTPYAGRTALVTGSSRGLGAATAKLLARQGADVVVTYRKREDAALEVAAAIEAEGRRAWVQRCDVGELDDIEALMDLVADPDRGPGRLDVLVANAAATSFRPLLEAEPRHLDKTFAISVTGFLRLVQRAVPLLEASGHGRVVAVSGVDTVTWIPAHGILAAAKAAMESMVAYLGVELAERGVTVVGVNPGWIDGDSLKLMLGPFYDHLSELEARTHPMRQTMSPDDVAESVALLCGDAAKLMNGGIVRADGGGVFSFCGRYINLGVEAALNALPPDQSIDGAAPSVTVTRPGT